MSGHVAALAGRGHYAGRPDRLLETTYRTITKELLTPVKPRPTTPIETARFSIVVLPFANLSADPNQGYLANAITENLTTGMSRFFPVIARNTAFS